MSLDASSVSGQSTQTFITALVLNLAIAGAEVVAFMLIRKKFKKIYEPRTYLVPPKHRVDDLPHGLFSWIPAILRADSKLIIAKNGLDAYVFVRFLYLMIEIFLPFTIATWVILLPVDAANSGGTANGVDIFTYGNVGPNATARYAAHLIMVWILTFWVFYLLKRESAAFVILRQDFLISKEHSRLAQSKTVLVTGVAKEYLTVEALTQFCSILPGGVKRVWLARNLGDLPDVFDRRLDACGKLESAETSMLKMAAKAIRKNKVKDAPTPAELEADHSLISRYVSRKDRPTHRLGSIPCVGKVVDTIEWCREEIRVTTEELEKGREVLGGTEADAKYPAESAAFIQFHSQIAAHMFAQCLAHHMPLRMSARYLEVDQEDVIWANLNINPYQAKIRFALSWLMTLGLIVLWAFPVAFVGLVSNVSQLSKVAPFLSWLGSIPAPLGGIIQGILPPVLLAVLFILLPIILRLFARFEGIPLHSQIELSLMSRFFLFLVIHGFLIVTLSSGLVASIPSIVNNPSSAITLLANKLPAASTFFLTYFAVQGLSGAAGALLQIVPLIIYYVKLYILGSTPRAVFGIKFGMGGVQWGTLFPNMTLLTIIGLTYSVIAPLVAGFALLAFALFFFVYKYLFLWVYDVPPASETGGQFYPRALSHIFVGLYIEQICLAGLFFLGSANAEGAFMVILILITIGYQLVLSAGYKPLVAFLPLSLAARIAEIQGEPATPELNAESSNFEGARMNSTVTDEKKRQLPVSNDFPPRAQDTYAENDRTNLLGTKGGALLSSQASETITLPGEGHLDHHAFDHPATYEEQRTVWVPVDDHGLWKGEVEDTRAAGVEISTQGATMDAKGNVAVTRSPPDDEWDISQRL